MRVMPFPRNGAMRSLMVLVLLGGCATGPITVSENGIRDAKRAFGPSQIATCETVEANRDRHILALSSGGADGAFGAGVMVGWSQTGQRPLFDVVTGVSTGAIQATHVFLGPGHDAELTRAFTQTSTRDVLAGNGILALKRPGLASLRPLRAQLNRSITDEVLEDVAAQHRQGRRLYVATTDLQNGRRVIWDMGAIAASPQADRRQLYIGVLLASSAFPGAVEPVAVRNGLARTLHGDGAVTTPVLLDFDMLEGACGVRSHVWVVANGHVADVGTRPLAGDGVVALARFGLAHLLRQNLYTTVESLRLRSQSHGTFHLFSLPVSVNEAANPLEFQPSEMALLFLAGIDAARAMPRSEDAGIAAQADMD